MKSEIAYTISTKEQWALEMRRNKVQCEIEFLNELAFKNGGLTIWQAERLRDFQAEAEALVALIKL